ncbi:glycosyltransferase [Candidatus Kaiserbacteria bacterium]|nr:glycosyltransferase [Candidatus Kaiserbacteria bacterium]
MSKTLLYVANVRLPTDNAHGVQIMKTCEALAEEGLAVTLIHPWRINKHKGDPFAVYRVKRNFRLITVPSLDTLMLGRTGFWFQNVTFGLTVVAYLLFRRFDVVYSRDEFPLFLASFVAKRCVWESHTGRLNPLIARLLRRIKGLVVISKGLQDLYVERGFPHDRIVVAPDGVSLEDFAHPQSKEESRRRLGLPPDTRVALYIGKLDGWKGVETFCTASEYLPDIPCAVIGGEPEEIQALSAKYPKVRFLGWRPYGELADNQAAADVLVLPNTGRDEISVRFTSPLKLFTYMASGRPIVCSDLPSLREILDDTSAFWFKPDDAKDCACAISEVFTHKEEAAARARSACALVERFSWSARARTIHRGSLEGK